MRGLIVGLLALFIFVISAVFLWFNETRRKTRLAGKLDKYWNLEERRKFVRLPKKLAVVCEFAKRPNSRWSIFSKDISGEGICIYIPEMLPQGAQVDLRIDIPQINENISVGGTVVWVKESQTSDEQGRKQFNAGIKFTEISSKDKRRLVNFINYSLKNPDK